MESETNNKTSDQTAELAEPANPTKPTQPSPGPEPKKSSRTREVVLVIFLIALMFAGGISIVISLSKTRDYRQINHSAPDQEASTTEKDEYGLSAISDFDLTFLKQENKKENVIYSPLSIKYALAMLVDASANDSEAQIKNLIGDFRPRAYLNSKNLSLANAMFIREQVKDEILSSYTDGIKEKYNAEVIFDPFASEANANKWISDRTLGIIKNTLSSDDIAPETRFLLINALAIDMKWNYLIQCDGWSEDEDKPKCMVSSTPISLHENIDYYVHPLDSSQKGDFDGHQVPVAKIGAAANRYNIVEEVGEETIRKTVLEEYEKWKEEWKEKLGIDDDRDYDIDKYIAELNSNYGKIYNSSDFYFNNTDTEKVFAKDLKEYDGTTLQYVGILPKNEDLNDYIENLDAKKVSSLIDGLKEISDINSYKEGVVTKVTGTIPFYDFSYNLELKKNLIELGVTDVFDIDNADLTKLSSTPGCYIQNAIHKANINFSNEGIKAAAITVLGGGMGSAPSFEYRWDVPIEEIDLSFDKPFFFLIRDKATGAVWFTGKVFNPTE